MESKEVKFGETSTRKALFLIAVCVAVIVKNIASAVNMVVHRLPWVFIILIIVTSFITCHVLIGKARVERDQYNKTVVSLEQQLAKYKSVYGEQ